MVANDADIGKRRLQHRKGNYPSSGVNVILCIGMAAMVHHNSLLVIVVSNIILVPLQKPSLVLVLRGSINDISGFIMMWWRVKPFGSRVLRYSILERKVSSGYSMKSALLSLMAISDSISFGTMHQPVSQWSNSYVPEAVSRKHPPISPLIATRHLY